MSDPPRDSPPPPDPSSASAGSDPLSRSALDNLRADPEVQRAMAELDGDRDDDADMWKVDPVRSAPASEHREHVAVQLGKSDSSAPPSLKPSAGSDAAEPKVVVADPAIDPAEYHRLPAGDRRAATVVSLQKVASAPRSITGTARLVTPRQVRERRSDEAHAQAALSRPPIDIEARTLGGGTQRGLPSPAASAGEPGADELNAGELAPASWAPAS